MTRDPSPTTIYLVRHAESEANAQGTLGGHGDVGLTTRGRSQAQRLAARLAEAGAAAVVSSDLRRARETAEPVASALGLAVHPEPRLRELHAGDWEGLSAAAIARDHAELWEDILRRPHAELRLPGGESLRELRERVHAAYQEAVARHVGESAVLVAHGNAIGMLLGALLDLPYSSAWRFQMHNTGVSVVRDFGGTPVVVSVNDTSHLAGLE